MTDEMPEEEEVVEETGVVDLASLVVEPEDPKIEEERIRLIAELVARENESAPQAEEESTEEE